mmetsp:Transcript_8839/g.18340  ORF Transcript_8839/g.18340 Transcript_8839/m.18340 type:complete len:80 (+) Transcript_8839:202-441(+)
MDIVLSGWAELTNKVLVSLCSTLRPDFNVSTDFNSDTLFCPKNHMCNLFRRGDLPGATSALESRGRNSLPKSPGSGNLS